VVIGESVGSNSFPKGKVVTLLSPYSKCISVERVCAVAQRSPSAFSKLTVWKRTAQVMGSQSTRRGPFRRL